METNSLALRAEVHCIYVHRVRRFMVRTWRVPFSACMGSRQIGLKTFDSGKRVFSARHASSRGGNPTKLSKTCFRKICSLALRAQLAQERKNRFPKDRDVLFKQSSAFVKLRWGATPGGVSGKTPRCPWVRGARPPMGEYRPSIQLDFYKNRNLIIFVSGRQFYTAIYNVICTVIKL